MLIYKTWFININQVHNSKELLEYESPSPSCSGSEGDSGNNHNYSYDFVNNFEMIIGWGRMALLIDYNSDNETIKLRDDDAVGH